MKSIINKHNNKKFLKGTLLISAMSLALICLTFGIGYAGSNSMQLIDHNPIWVRLGITEVFLLLMIPILYTLLKGLKMAFNIQVEKSWFKGMTMVWYMSLILLLVSSVPLIHSIQA